MMKRVLLVGLVVVLAVGLLLSGCTGSKSNSASNAPASNRTESSAPAQPIVMKLGHGTATDSLYHIGATKFAELVEKKTGGKIKVEIFPNGQLGHDRDLTEGMALGTIQAGAIGSEPLVSWAPKLKIVNLPYLFMSREHAYKVLDGPLGQEMTASLPAKGVRNLAYFENGFRQMTNSKKPINTPEDLKGLKIRVPQSPVSIAIFKALGANPTPMSFGELYTALQQKTVDGQENPLSLINSSKFYEVNKYISITNHIYSPFLLIVSEKWYTSLSPDLQKAVQEAANEARDYERKVSAQQEKDLIDQLKEKGALINTPDITLFRKATADVHKEFDNDYGTDFYAKILAAK